MNTSVLSVLGLDLNWIFQFESVTEIKGKQAIQMVNQIQRPTPAMKSTNHTKLVAHTKTISFYFSSLLLQQLQQLQPHQCLYQHQPENLSSFLSPSLSSSFYPF
jgi:hypothetical protein